MTDELRDFKGSKKALLQSYAKFKCLMADEIVYVGAFIDPGKGELGTNIAEIVKCIRKDLEYVGTLDEELGGSTYINGESLIDAYKLTLIMSCDAHQEIVQADYVRSHWEGWFKWYEAGVSVQSPLSPASSEHTSQSLDHTPCITHYMLNYLAY